MISVGTLGSCRVHTPLKLAGDRKQITYVADNLIGYVHNSKEVIQDINILHGKVAVPENLRRLVNFVNLKSKLDTDVFASIYRKVDMFVVEVSSIRLVEFRNLFLQIHRFRELLAGIDPSNQWEKKIQGPAEAWREHVQGVMAGRDLDPATREIVLDSTVREQAVKEIVADLSAISMRLHKPVLFVSHFCNDYQGKPIAQRATIREALRIFSSDLPHIAYFDPSTLVERYGLETALLDLGHYKPAFEETVSVELLKAVKAHHASLVDLGLVANPG